MKKPARKDLSWGERLAFALVGFLTIVYGYGKMLRGQWIYENWRGLDITAWFVIVLGVLFLLVAVFPWGRIHFLWDPGRKRHRR
jgi:multisubunit Na+/H+ antiporter MnhB subunit